MTDEKTAERLKKDLRQMAKVRRKEAWTAGAGAELSAQALRGIDLFSRGSSAIVAGYWPMGDELDLRPLLQALHTRGVALALPVLVGAARPLIFRRWQPGDCLCAAGFGTQEPTADQAVCRPDIVLVPLLAFDAQGGRLGYGGGFYDRTLARFRTEGGRVCALGVALSAQEVPAVVCGPHDQPLDGVITEKGVRFFGEAPFFGETPCA